MPSQSLDQLIKQFQQHTEVRFSKTESGLVMVHIDNVHCMARLCLQGAHLCRFALKLDQDLEELLWLSRTSSYVTGKAIRGGIPICWPWFGNHPSNTNLPAHGFARVSEWQLIKCRSNNDGSTELTLLLESTDESLKLWPHEFRLELRVTLGSELKIALTTHNMGAKPMTQSSALHTYLSVHDIAQTEVLGLDNVRYFDKNINKFSHQQGPLTIDKATDYVYQNTHGAYELIDRGASRMYTISKEHSDTTVIWNPWQEAAHRMQDFDDQGYTQMICIEAANFDLDTIYLEPGKHHTLTQKIKLNMISN